MPVHLKILAGILLLPRIIIYFHCGGNLLCTSTILVTEVGWKQITQQTYVFQFARLLNRW